MKFADQTFSQEFANAARGTIAILRGQRDCASYFDLSLRGLAGSFVAFFISIAMSIFLPALVSDTSASSTDLLARQGGELASAPGSVTVLFIIVALALFQIGFGAIALRQFNRLDGLLSYLVMDNWTGFFSTALSVILLMIGDPGGISMLIVLAVALISKINICRLVLDLKAAQIAMFLVAQLIGVLSGLILLEAILPGFKIA